PGPVRGAPRVPGEGGRLRGDPRRAGGRPRDGREPGAGARARRLLPAVRVHPGLRVRRPAAVRGPGRGDDGPRPGPGPPGSDRHHRLPAGLRRLIRTGGGRPRPGERALPAGAGLFSHIDWTGAITMRRTGTDAVAGPPPLPRAPFPPPRSRLLRPPRRGMTR